MIKVNDYFGLAEESGTLELVSQILGIPDNVEITVISNNYVLDQAGGKDYVADGLLYKNEMPGNHFNLYVRSGGEVPLRTVLCHEMLHLKQFLSGDLEWDPKTRIFKWKGSAYPYNTPYNSRPWEQEVFKIQNQLLYKVRLAKGKKPCALLNIFKKK